ncbi:MAG: DmsE family decaheme c-type cytochrome [Acidobacteria bacterium]|nr:DmsE family decaheme c-type cytochrome [Acidobacteriota bacterium]
MRRAIPGVFLSAVVIAWLAASGWVLTASATPAQQAAAPETAGGTYAGTEVCLTCHTEKADSLKGTPHGRASNPRSPLAGQGCEACHGPGKAHAEAGDATLIRRFGNGGLAPRASAEVCTACHVRGTHALWTGSQHEQRNVGCVTCHSVHSPRGDKQIKAATQPELCGGCHRQMANKFYRFNHMPVREGKMVCSSCHNPHGSSNVKLLKAGTTVDQACTSCHAEKRGPYLWEHAPVTNSCVTCHDPHGSNNERLLVAKVPFLCQRCHVTARHPPTVYEGFALRNTTSANRLIGSGCVVCHVQIHGSNAPSGKYFHR